LHQRTTRRHKTAPTITDVADAAGVSPMTVSRVINGEANVRERTRDAVNAAIARLGYAPNRAARSLAGGGELRIALLYSNPSAAYLGEILLGGLDRIGGEHAQLVIEQCDPGPREMQAIEHLIGAGIDGVVLPPPLCDSPAAIDALQAADIPMVIVASGRPRPDVPAVSIDDAHAAEEMTRHLGALGHRRIGFICGNPNQSSSAKRLDGYRAAVADLRLDDDPELVVPGLFSYRSGLEAAERLLGLANPPTAIFASNDDMAAASVAVAHRHRLDVPGDLTICGFDDTPLATTIWPELTTIRQPIREMSRTAVDLLLATIRGRRSHATTPPRHLLLDYALVQRHSDGAPKA
jgi:LacI family transcriptional regulator